MSGHNNPHGHLGQPNASWNLQVPLETLVPQFAHMSSERPISHSPLTWHTPSGAVFSYLANDLNSLLPALRRTQNTTPFGTVDLSLAHATKTVSPKPFSTSPSRMGDTPAPVSIGQQPLPSISPQPSSIQSTALVTKERTNNCNNSTTLQGLIVKDARQINNDIMKFTRNEMLPTQNTDPDVDVAVKIGAVHNPIKSLPIVSPKKNSPLRPSILPNQSPTPTCHTPPIPPTNQQPAPSPSAATPTMSNLQNQPETSSVEFSAISTDSNSAMSVELQDGSPTISTGASKKRNRRKPNKTTKVFNEEESHDEDPVYDGKFNGVGSNGVDEQPVDGEKLTAKLPPLVVDPATNGSPTPATERPPAPETSSANGGDAVAVVVENNLSSVGKGNACDIQEQPSRSQSTTEVGVVNKKNDQNDEGLVKSESKIESTTATIGRSKGKTAMTTSTPTTMATTKKKGRRKATGTIDSAESEVETIDKIAEMISNTSKEFDSTTESLEGKEQVKEEISATTSASQVKNVVAAKPVVGGAKDPLKNESNYEDVENKLEEMFAGIEEDLSAREEPVDNVLLIAATSTIDLTGGDSDLPPKKKPGRPPASSAKSEKTDDPDETGSVPAKKGRPPLKKNKNFKANKSNNNTSAGTSKKNNKANNKSGSIAGGSGNINKSKMKDETNVTGVGETKYKGPFLQVKKCGNMSVINTPIADDDAEKSISKSKKNIHRETMNDRNKIRGLHVSTLSMKYDADTTDQTWLCVFCKLGPHKSGLGDLFGPYIVTTDSEEFQYSQVDPEDDVFSEKRSKLDFASKRVPTGSNQLNSPQAKKRKKNSESPQPSGSGTSKSAATGRPDINIYAGMVKANENTYEVWVHEECAVWAPGVHMIGARIVGLEAAIWTSCRHKCTICNSYGAMLSCLKHNCTEKAHISCAYSSNWKLGTDFKSFCETHNV